MRVFIDISVLTLATFVTGIQRVCREITLHLLDRGEPEIVLLHYNAREDAYHIIDNQAFVRYYRQHRGVKNRMITRRRQALEEMGRGDIFFDLDAVWMCRMRRSYLLPILKGQGVRIVAHIYDIISVTHPQYCLERGVYQFMDYLGAHLQYADQLIVNAQATVDELRRLADELEIPLPSCYVAPLGADFRQHCQIPGEQVPENVRQAADSAPYILMVGTIEPRKNHRLLLQAYDAGLREAGYHIILAGYTGWHMERFMQELYARADYNRGIYHFDSLGDSAVDYLYQHARFLAFCSYAEGFGLPLLEAVSRGTPVVAADIPVSREVMGEYCDWFRQDDPADLCRAVMKYEDEDRYRRRKESLKDCRPASWARCCERMLRGIRGDSGEQTQT
ncbi:MAG: glycosyltransferase family 4 protein [Acetatifactor sp.]